MNTVVSEDLIVKAVRLLAMSRVTITSVTDGQIAASVRGDTGVLYRVTGGPQGLSCSCPAFGDCAHIFAVARVVPGPWR